MHKQKFQLSEADSLIILPCIVSDEEVSLALDTGASHTVVDLTKLLIAGYKISESLRNEVFETAKGTVEALVFKVDTFHALGTTLKNIEVCSYDFLGNNVLSEIDGVLGLDFFRNTDLRINFKTSEIFLS